MAVKQKVKIVEVGLRDGLQNESTTLSIEQRFHILETDPELILASVPLIFSSQP